MGLVPVDVPLDARWFGIGVHIALAQWYKPGKRRGSHPADTFEAWIDEQEQEIRASYEDKGLEWYDEDKLVDARELGIAMLEAYVDEYGKDSKWHIIAIEEPFSVKVERGGKALAIFKSTWDGVFRDLRDGRIYLLENKTASQIDTAYLPLDDQAGVYWAVASAILRKRGILKDDQEIAGILYNFLRKSKPDPRPRNSGGAYLNQDGTVSKRQPSERFSREIVERSQSELHSQMMRLADEVAVMEAMRTGVIPVTKNTTRDCARFCDFFDMCTLHERGGSSWKTIMKSDFVQVDPYARYTVKSAGGGG
jgi:hypothetical protein